MTKLERMAAYREAARMVAEGEEEFSCNAIREGMYSSTDDPGWIIEAMISCYADMICPSESQKMRAFDFPLLNGWNEEAAQAHRVLALLLAAEMVRTGDL